ncbi:MAG: hypothetical protein C0459_13085 [Chitinophaga sp.]|nr:hypothetical protein [Chitinophaga sp.]
MEQGEEEFTLLMQKILMAFLLLELDLPIIRELVGVMQIQLVLALQDKAGFHGLVAMPQTVIFILFIIV